MFDAEDFELPLEKKLKLRIILDEVDHCSDVEVLRESLKSCAEQLIQYQHMLGKAVEKNLIYMVSEIDDKIGEMLRDANA